MLISLRNRRSFHSLFLLLDGLSVGETEAILALPGKTPLLSLALARG